MNLSRGTALLCLSLGLWACDPADPSGGTPPQNDDPPVEEGAGGVLSGSVFVNDGDDDDPAREPSELGILAVRVDVFAAEATDPTASVLTDEKGHYEVAVPAGEWSVRVTPAASEDAFNETLYAFYAVVAGLDDRTVEVPRALQSPIEIEDLDFGFDPDLGAILEALRNEPYRTRGDAPEEWEQWLRDLRDGQGCAAHPGTAVCESEVDAYLDEIFATGGQGDTFFGNEEPFKLPPETDPYDQGIDILGAPQETDLDSVRVELFAAEINYFAGRGSFDDNFDRTLLSYFEEYVVVVEGRRRLRARPVSVQLAVLLAYNRGGGGGKVGD